MDPDTRPVPDITPSEVDESEGVALVTTCSPGEAGSAGELWRGAGGQDDLAYALTTATEARRAAQLEREELARLVSAPLPEQVLPRTQAELDGLSERITGAVVSALAAAGRLPKGTDTPPDSPVKDANGDAIAENITRRIGLELRLDSPTPRGDSDGSSLPRSPSDGSVVSDTGRCLTALEDADMRRAEEKRALEDLQAAPSPDPSPRVAIPPRLEAETVTIVQHAAPRAAPQAEDVTITPPPRFQPPSLPPSCTTGRGTQASTQAAIDSVEAVVAATERRVAAMTAEKMTRVFAPLPPRKGPRADSGHQGSLPQVTVTTGDAEVPFTPTTTATKSHPSVTRLSSDGNTFGACHEGTAVHLHPREGMELASLDVSPEPDSPPPGSVSSASSEREELSPPCSTPCQTPCDSHLLIDAGAQQFLQSAEEPPPGGLLSEGGPREEAPVQGYLLDPSACPEVDASGELTPAYQPTAAPTAPPPSTVPCTFQDVGADVICSDDESDAAPAMAEEDEMPAPPSPTVGVPRMMSVTTNLAPKSPEVVAADPGSPIAGVPRMTSVTAHLAPQSPEVAAADPGSPVAGVPRMTSVSAHLAPQSPEIVAADPGSPVAGVPRMMSITAGVAPQSPEGVADLVPSATEEGVGGAPVPSADVCEEAPTGDQLIVLLRQAERLAGLENFLVVPTHVKETIARHVRTLQQMLAGTQAYVQNLAEYHAAIDEMLRSGVDGYDKECLLRLLVPLEVYASDVEKVEDQILVTQLVARDEGLSEEVRERLTHALASLISMLEPVGVEGDEVSTLQEYVTAYDTAARAVVEKISAAEERGDAAAVLHDVAVELADDTACAEQVRRRVGEVGVDGVAEGLAALAEGFPYTRAAAKDVVARHREFSCRVLHLLAAHGARAAESPRRGGAAVDNDALQQRVLRNLAAGGQRLLEDAAETHPFDRVHCTALQQHQAALETLLLRTAELSLPAARAHVAAHAEAARGVFFAHAAGLPQALALPLRAHILRLYEGVDTLGILAQRQRVANLVVAGGEGSPAAAAAHAALVSYHKVLHAAVTTATPFVKVFPGALRAREEDIKRLMASDDCPATVQHHLTPHQAALSAFLGNLAALSPHSSRRRTEHRATSPATPLALEPARQASPDPTPPTEAVDMAEAPEVRPAVSYLPMPQAVAPVHVSDATSPDPLAVTRSPADAGEYVSPQAPRPPPSVESKLEAEVLLLAEQKRRVAGLVARRLERGEEETRTAAATPPAVEHGDDGLLDAFEGSFDEGVRMRLEAYCELQMSCDVSGSAGSGGPRAELRALCENRIGCITGLLAAPNIPGAVRKELLKELHELSGAVLRGSYAGVCRDGPSLHQQRVRSFLDASSVAPGAPPGVTPPRVAARPSQARTPGTSTLLHTIVSTMLPADALTQPPLESPQSPELDAAFRAAFGRERQRSPPRAATETGQDAVMAYEKRVLAERLQSMTDAIGQSPPRARVSPPRASPPPVLQTPPADDRVLRLQDSMASQGAALRQLLEDITQRRTR